VFGGEDKLIEPYGRNPLVEHTWFEGAVVPRDLTRQEELRVMTPWNCSVACKVARSSPFSQILIELPLHSTRAVFHSLPANSV
jgi:hypothetical protein